MRRILILISIINTYSVVCESFGNCGNVKQNVEIFNKTSLIKHGDFPWMTALIAQSATNVQSYLCGAIIISIEKVITAAHCLHSKNRLLFPKDVLIAMGVHDIEKKFELNRVVMESNEFFIHPDWSPFNKNYDSDIAIIKTNHQIQFTEYIQPICLWASHQNIPATSGIAVGYGINDQSIHKKERIARKLQIFIHQNEECIATETKLSGLDSNRTICGESIYGSSICFGDSGHGLFVKVKNKFYLRGIISASPKFANNSCTLTHYGIYTNVIKYKDWIDNPEKYHRNSDTCGIMSSAVSLIQGGNYSQRDQFPWTALIKYSSSFYSGVLISQKHVLTYSSSVSFWNNIEKKYIPQHLNAFKIYFGITEVNSQDDPNVVTENPAKIILHPHLQKVGITVINAVGIVVLESSVPYNEFIKPICLWNNQNYFNKDLKMFAVGYGKDETGKHSKVRKYSRMMHSSDEVCRDVYADRSSAFESTKLFCAQGNEHETPCDGDTPLIMKFEDKWYIRGIMISFRYWMSNETCVYNKPLLYEDIAYHAHWILSQTIL